MLARPIVRMLGIIAAALALTALAACSGSGSKKSSAGGSHPVIPGATGAIANQLDVHKQCAAVTSGDLQKLFKGAVPALVVNPLECDWGQGAITVSIYFNDTTKKYYTGGAVGAGGTPLSGVGDIAHWIQPVQGHTVPFIAAHKASTTCTVDPGIDVDQTSMQYSGHAPIFTVPDAAAAQYAAEEGQLCNDVFSVSS